MGEQQDTNGGFAKAFVPGLVLGLVIGAFVGATMPAMLSGAKLPERTPGTMNSSPRERDEFPDRDAIPAEPPAEESTDAPPADDQPGATDPAAGGPNEETSPPADDPGAGGDTDDPDDGG